MAAVGSYASEHWGDFVTVAGFAFTLYFVISAQTTARAVQRAVEKLRNQFTQLDCVYRLAAAKVSAEQIIGLHDSGRWEELLPRYPLLRQELISVAESKSGLCEQDVELLSEAIQTLRDVEKAVRDAIYVDRSPSSPSVLTGQVSLVEDHIVTVIARLKTQSIYTE